jgi:uncharacterized OsmC-like protein
VGSSTGVKSYALGWEGFRAALSEKQRARLLAIANRCPVHRTLTSEVVIETRLSVSGGQTP